MTRPALLVIDLQRGAFDGARCPPVAAADALIESAVRLVAAARAGKAPVVFIQHCEGAGEPFEQGTAHWELHQALVPHPGDAVVHKQASSAFDGTDLAAVLQRLGTRELVLCGLQSEFCVSNTAKSALAHGFAVVVAEDGHGTWPSQGQTAEEISAEANRALREAGASVRTVAELERTLAETRA